MSELPEEPNADPDWFRQPTSREHRIAGWLFLAFGVFFLMLFVVLRGWWFRWVIAGLGVYSIVFALGHLRDSRGRR